MLSKAAAALAKSGPRRGVTIAEEAPVCKGDVALGGTAAVLPAEQRNMGVFFPIIPSECRLAFTIQIG